MELSRKFREARDAAFDEIQKAMTDKIRDLAYANVEFMKDKKDGLNLPDHVQVSETFRWPAALTYAAGDLKEGKRSLKEIFARVSSRYEGNNPQQVLGVADDFTRSPAAKLDGRASAFEDLYKLLDVAERDFDLTYKPQSKDMLEYWHKKHPIGADHLEYAYRENQRHFQKQSIDDMRKFLQDLETGKPAAGAKPASPKP